MEETRYYIGLIGGLHAMFKIGPTTPDKFLRGPTDPIPLGETMAYPVSAEIAAEWVINDDEEAASDGTLQ